MLVKDMLRVARITAAGYPHHITQRGNYRQRHIPGSILEHIRGNYSGIRNNYGVPGIIFNIANYGIVGDLFQVVPALTGQFKEKLHK